MKDYLRKILLTLFAISFTGGVKAVAEQESKSLLLQLPRDTKVEVVRYLMSAKSFDEAIRLPSLRRLAAVSQELRKLVIDALLEKFDLKDPQKAQKELFKFARTGKGGHFALSALIEGGADINKPNKNGLTPLMSAARSGSPQGIRFLLERGVSANKKDQDGRSALMHAIMEGEEKEGKVALLLYEGDINEKDIYGETPLMKAMFLKNPYRRTFNTDIVKFLLENGAKVNEQSHQGDTALMLASSWGNTDAVKLLLEYGADPNLKNIKNETALMLAYNQEIKELLTKAVQEKNIQKHLRESSQHPITPRQPVVPQRELPVTPKRPITKSFFEESLKKALKQSKEL